MYRHYGKILKSGVVDTAKLLSTMTVSVGQFSEWPVPVRNTQYAVPVLVMVAWQHWRAIVNSAQWKIVTDKMVI